MTPEFSPCQNPGCENLFPYRPSKRFCSEKCRNKAKAPTYRKTTKMNAAMALGDKYVPQTRKCHDCPRKTANYRCDSCRDKWRKLHNVAGE